MFQTQICVFKMQKLAKATNIKQQDKDAYARVRLPIVHRLCHR